MYKIHKNTLSFYTIDIEQDILARIQGRSRPVCQKTALTTFLVINSFYVVYSGGPIVYQWYYFRENYSFQRVHRGSNIFQGRSKFYQGGGERVQMQISIETHITCDFQGEGGGVRTSYPPPSGSAHVML